MTPKIAADLVNGRTPRSFCDAQIEMAHGAGGHASRRLLDGLIVPLLLGKPSADGLPDAALLDLGGARRLALTTDAFVVHPLSFPGGSIGTLAVNGTANDLTVSGARPRALVISFVIEAGLPTPVLESELRAIADAAARAGVEVIGGDTKVVERGKADGLYITSAGVGLLDPRAVLDARTAQPGDRVLLSGPIGDHGCTVLVARAQVDLEAALTSDTRAIWPMVDRLLHRCGPALRWMRDPTRGGVATALNELARDADLAVRLDEAHVPVRDEVRGVCELLGLDPLHIANEGQFLAVVAPDYADEALEAIREVPGGDSAAIIGELQEGPRACVVGESPFGGTRLIDMLVGDPLPRIC